MKILMKMPQSCSRTDRLEKFRCREVEVELRSGLEFPNQPRAD